MIDLDFSFEESPWERYLRSKQAGDVISAANLLTLLEGEEEQSFEDALQELETACMKLDVSGLPKTAGTGEAAARLRQELELVKKGLTPESLEESDPLRLYLEEVAMTPAFGDEQLLAEECAAGKQSTMERLTNLGLSRVIQIAGEHVGYGVLLLDLIQEGSLGLWQAICNYRSGDYASHRDRWIRLYMAKAVTMQADLGRNPTLEEIALELHMTPEEALTVKNMLDNARLLTSAKKQPEPEEEAEEDNQAVEDTALFRMRQRISDLLSGLNEEDARLLNLRFGLEGGKPMTPEEVGRRLGLTPDEVVAREGAALAKLRNK